jgi:hypothetical protein
MFQVNKPLDVFATIEIPFTELGDMTFLAAGGFGKVWRYLYFISKKIMLQLL